MLSEAQIYVSQVMRECCWVLESDGEAWIYDPARIHSGMTKVVEVFAYFAGEALYKLFAFYQWFDRAHYYHYPEFVQIIAATDFSVRWIEEKDGEMRIKLRKA